MSGEDDELDKMEEGTIDIDIDLSKPSSESLDKPPEEITEDELEELGIEIDTDDFPDELLKMPPEEFLENYKLKMQWEYEPEWEPSDDRDRGFLTKADRQYLRGESEIESKSHSERKIRERIRNRIFHAFLDFSLVVQFLQDRDREQIFANPNRSPGEEIALWNGAIHALAFVYERLKEEQEYDFKYSLDAAVLAVEQGPATVSFSPVDVTFDVDASGVADLGTVGEKIKSGRPDTLTKTEIKGAKFMVNKDAAREGGISQHAKEQALSALNLICEEFVDDEDTAENGNTGTDDE